MTTLFEKPAEPRQAEPVETHERGPCFYQLYAVEKLNAPSGWRVVVLDSSPERVPQGFFKMEGAVCPSNKFGTPVWRKRDVSTVRVFFVRWDEFRPWCEAYAAERGKCDKCWGSGREVASFGISGTKYRQCSKCNGSGKPSAACGGDGVSKGNEAKFLD